MSQRVLELECETARMAGTRHHIIPQFLLRGFASHTIGDAIYSWVYRRTGKPFNANVINIAVEGHFYTLDGNPEVDDQITQAEGPLGHVVDHIRRTQSTHGIEREELGRLFAHLEVRTRHLRINFETLGAKVLERVSAFFADTDSLMAFYLRKHRRDPNELKNMISDELRRAGVPQLHVPSVLEIIRPQMEIALSTLLPRIAEEAGASFRRMLAERPEMLKEAAKRAQLRALREAIAPEIKELQYASLAFEVMEMPEGNILLGDSAVIAQVTGPRRYKTFVEVGDQLEALYLPLSSSLVLCAHGNDGHVDLPSLPVAVARCALEFFVVSSPSPAYENLQSEMGKLSTLVDDSVIDDALFEAFNE
jgi:hypothetical protein